MFSDQNIDQDVIVSQHAHDRAVERLGFGPREAWGKTRWLCEIGKRVSPSRLPPWFRRGRHVPTSCYILCSWLGQDVVLVLHRLCREETWTIVTVVDRYCALSSVPA